MGPGNKKGRATGESMGQKRMASWKRKLSEGRTTHGSLVASTKLRLKQLWNEDSSWILDERLWRYLVSLVCFVVYEAQPCKAIMRLTDCMDPVPI